MPANTYTTNTIADKSGCHEQQIIPIHNTLEIATKPMTPIKQAKKTVIAASKRQESVRPALRACA